MYNCPYLEKFLILPPVLVQEGLECDYKRIHFINISGACDLPPF